MLPIIEKTKRQYTTIILIILNVLLLISFIFLTRDVLDRILSPYDKDISLFIYSIRTPFLTTIMRCITFLASGAIVILVSSILIVIFFARHRYETNIFIITLIGGAILNYVLKISFRQYRPTISPLELLTDYTYPSGHSMNTVILYGLFTYFSYHFTKSKKILIFSLSLSIIWTILVGFSRIYLGSHYPSDVLGGYIVGLWWLDTVLLLNNVYSSFRRRNISKQ